MSFIIERLKSFAPAFKGLFWFFRNEKNARVHLLAIVVVVAAGFYFDIEKTEWLVIVLTIGIVVTAEALNTAIEKWVDLVSPERSEKAGRIKDIAAGAVLFAALAAICIAGIIFLPKLF